MKNADKTAVMWIVFSRLSPSVRTQLSIRVAAHTEQGALATLKQKLPVWPYPLEVELDPG